MSLIRFQALVINDWHSAMVALDDPERWMEIMAEALDAKGRENLRADGLLAVSHASPWRLVLPGHTLDVAEVEQTHGQDVARSLAAAIEQRPDDGGALIVWRIIMAQRIGEDGAALWPLFGAEWLAARSGDTS